MDDISCRDTVPADGSYQLYSSGPVGLHQTPQQPSHLLLLFTKFTLLWISCYYIVCIAIGYSVWPKRGSPAPDDCSNSPPSSLTTIKSELSSSSEGMGPRMIPESSDTAAFRKIQSPCPEEMDAILTAAATYPSHHTVPAPPVAAYDPVAPAKFVRKTPVAPWQPKPGELVMRLRPPSCVLTGSPDEMETHDGPFIVSSSRSACPRRLSHLDPDGLAAWVEIELPDISRAERWWKDTDLRPYEGKTTASHLRDAWVPRGGFYLLEKIRAERRKRGGVKYKVSWKGWPSEDDTWEWPESIEGLEEVLEVWEARKTKWGRS